VLSCATQGLPDTSIFLNIPFEIFQNSPRAISGSDAEKHRRSQFLKRRGRRNPNTANFRQHATDRDISARQINGV